MRKITLNEMITELKEGLVILDFTKTNGEPRHMTATLNPELMPHQESEAGESRLSKQIAEGKVNALSVWDTGVNEWRSFRVANVFFWQDDEVEYAGS
jgi:hypothetical protein